MTVENCRERVAGALQAVVTAEICRLVDEGHLAPLVYGGALSALCVALHEILILCVDVPDQVDVLKSCTDGMARYLGEHHAAIGFVAVPAGATVQ